jgi:hypothetical protein
MAKLSDTLLLELARSESIKLMETDPGLTRPQNAALSKELLRVWGLKNGEWS